MITTAPDPLALGGCQLSSDDVQAPSNLRVWSHMLINPLALPAESPVELEASCEVPPPPAADVADPLLELPEEITAAHTQLVWLATTISPADTIPAVIMAIVLFIVLWYSSNYLYIRTLLYVFYLYKVIL